MYVFKCIKIYLCAGQTTRNGVLEYIALCPSTYRGLERVYNLLFLLAFVLLFLLLSLILKKFAP